MDSKTCVLCKENFNLCCNNCLVCLPTGVSLVIEERFKTDNSTNTPNNTPDNKMYTKTENFKTSELSAQNQHETSVDVDI
jgi:hypothetical protein